VAVTATRGTQEGKGNTVGKIRGRIVGSVLAGALFALALAGASLADHNPDYSGTADSHYVVDGNPKCPAGTTAGGSIKVDPGSNGTFDGLVTITGYDGQSFDWAFTDAALHLKDMAVVIVKGGPNAVIYTYDYQGSGVDDSDSGLTAPLNPDGNQEGETKFYGISHIEFCMDVKDGGGGPTGNLIVRKVVENSDASPTNWSFTVDGNTTQFNSVGEHELTLDAGTYTVTEPGANQNGYETTYSDDCIEVEVGPDVEPTPVCTITNTLVEEPPGDGGLIVRKIVSGTDDSPSSFSFQIDEGEPTQFEADGQNDVSLPDGAYDITEPEANENGYTTTYSNCDDVQVSSEGQTQVCTITNSKGTTSIPFVPPPTPKLDVWVQKGATPQATLENGSASIAYDIAVSNNGPNQANNVTLADNAPAGVSFVAITSAPSQGTCSITPSTLSCNFGVVGAGVVVTLSLSATVTSTGTYSNTVCVASDGEADTNLGNNCSTANTLVVAPVVPPTVTPPVAKPPVAKPPVVKKPKPRKPANVCAILTISTRTLAAGKYTGVVVKVTRAGKAVPNAKVRFKGPGIFKTVTTKKTGMVVTKLRPSKSGIVRVSVVNKKACSAKRIGVLGTFEPPVTG
jgi:uncharacterized repeat protein (TIGR01451 family)